MGKEKKSGLIERLQAAQPTRRGSFSWFERLQATQPEMATAALAIRETWQSGGFASHLTLTQVAEAMIGEYDLTVTPQTVGTWLKRTQEAT